MSVTTKLNAIPHNASAENTMVFCNLGDHIPQVVGTSKCTLRTTACIKPRESKAILLE
jgi:hypothetical protein